MPDSQFERAQSHLKLRPAVLVMPDAGLRKRFSRTLLRQLSLRKPRSEGELGETPAESDKAAVRHVEVSRDAPKPVRRIFRDLESFKNVSVYVHGSWADSTTTPFSDLDDLIIVDLESPMSWRELWALERVLNRIDLRFMRIDPLQHHGHWILEAGEWSTSLDESYMPLLVLDSGIRVQGPASFTCYVDHSVTVRGLARNIELAARGIEDLYAAYANRSANLYRVKQMVGSILLMPAYVFQANGQRIGKREAILRSKELYSAEAGAVIRWATAIRHDWGAAIRSPNLLFWSLLTRIIRSPRAFREIVGRYGPRFPYEDFEHLPRAALEEFIAESRRHIT